MPYTIHKGNAPELPPNLLPFHLIPIQEFQYTVVDVVVCQHWKQISRVAPFVMMPLQYVYQSRRSGYLFR